VELKYEEAVGTASVTKARAAEQDRMAAAAAAVYHASSLMKRENDLTRFHSHFLFGFSLQGFLLFHNS
jgi:hypothetical protein